MGIPKATGEETTLETFQRWLSDGTTWIGIFENHDLGDINVGRRIAVPYDVAQFDAAKLKVTRAPDHGTIGVGWRYLLVAKERTAEGAVAALAVGDTK